VGVVGPDYSVEFSAVDAGVETWAGAGSGLHRGDEAAEQTPLTLCAWAN